MEWVARRSLLPLALAVGVGAVLYLSGRTFIAIWNSRVLHSRDRPNSRVEITVFKPGTVSGAGIHGIAGGYNGCDARLFLEVPQTIRTSESKLVQARFEEKNCIKELASIYNVPPGKGSFYSFGFAAPDVLEIAPKERQVRRLQSSPSGKHGPDVGVEGSADCTWTVRPREPGEYTVFVDGIWQGSDGKPLPWSEPQSRQFTISALTSIGLPPKIASVLHFVSTVIGLIAVVLAFPFFKSRLERRRKAEPTARRKSRRPL
jgi:hypothetical protein